MKLTVCKHCRKTYPKGAMETKDYCSDWCLGGVQPYSVNTNELKVLIKKRKKS